ncbi:MAG TPA: efflux RND transporter periplasmic adaptor subunit, partial [Terriglobales bacterium]|nr:efflux RND transporter periplasmic adaptor subunit [Terriglobales bacterium]
MKSAIGRYGCGLALGLTLAAVGCGKTAAKAAADPPPAANAQLFTVPQNQMSHVQVVAAASVTWPRMLRLTGNVDFDQFATTPVITPVSGPVTRILAATGQQVQAGETLLEVSSPDVAAARSNYLKASDAVKLAQQVERRDQDLLEHHAIAQADLEQAQSGLEQSQADLETARAALKILGVAEPAPGSPATAVIAVKAPIAGQVVERDVAPGQLLQGGATQCFVISDTHKMWVLANVYQSDLDYVHVGDPVTIETDAYP